MFKAKPTIDMTDMEDKQSKRTGFDPEKLKRDEYGVYYAGFQSMAFVYADLGSEALVHLIKSFFNEKGTSKLIEQLKEEL